MKRSVSTNSGNSGGPDDNKRRNRATTLKKIFKPATEIDVGQDTSNPYILAMRHINGKDALTLDLLNAVLSFHGFSLIAEEFDRLKSLKAAGLPYPLPNNDPFTHSVVGPTTQRKARMVPGCYVLTVNRDHM